MTAAGSKSQVVSVRLTPDEHADLLAQARARGVSPAAHAHACMVDGMRRAAPGVVVKRLHNGAEITTWPSPSDLREM